MVAVLSPAHLPPLPLALAHDMVMGTDHSENASAITTIKSPYKKFIVQFGCISESRNCVNE